MPEFIESPTARRTPELSRRDMIRSSAAAGGAALAMAAPLLAGEPKPQRKIKLGLIGCGGRGVWIARLFLAHGGYTVHAVADYHPAVADRAGNALGTDKSRRFTGLGGYKKLLDSGVEAVVVIDVPYFYPEQAKAAVAAGCHVYMAKPIATDVPGCLAIGALGKAATQKKLCFLVDYQLPTAPENIEVATRIWDGAIGKIVHAQSIGFSGPWSDPVRGKTIENLLRGQAWLSSVALSGDSIVSYDIHSIDGALWVLRQRPVAASGASRIVRPNPHGDYRDATSVVYELPDGVIWTHRGQSLKNNEDSVLLATFHGTAANAQVNYWGKCFVRGGKKHYVGNVKTLYDQGAKHNIAAFHKAILAGDCANATVPRAVDGTLTAILGREAAARKTRLTMDELIKENKKLEVDLTGLKA
ncbi:Gfo/Idh/MocA family oxidoreductase [bacterium]|nr:Gfo/Idh/MocA family oxidoreductase [bacterium]